MQVQNNGVVTPEYYQLVQDIEDYLNTNIKKWGAAELNSTDCRLVFKREVIADVGLFLQKKRYVLHVLDNEGIPCNKFKYTGVEVVRTTMPAPVKPYVKKIVETLLLTQNQAETDKVFKAAYDVYLTLPIEDVASVRGISDYEKYGKKCSEFTTVKGMPFHVKAAYYHNVLLDRLGISNKYEKIRSGDKVKILYVKKPNPCGISVLGYKYYYPAEFKEMFHLNYELMFAKTIYSPIDRFYQAVGWRIKNPAMAVQTDLFSLLS